MDIFNEFRVKRIKVYKTCKDGELAMNSINGMPSHFQRNWE